MKIGTGRLLVLSALQYELTDEATKEKRSGVSLTYVTGSSDARDNRMGCEPVKASLPLSEWKSLSALPGWYDADLMMVTENVTKGGQRQTMQVIKPANLQYVAALVGPSATGVGANK